MYCFIVPLLKGTFEFIDVTLLINGYYCSGFSMAFMVDLLKSCIYLFTELSSKKENM